MAGKFTVEDPNRPYCSDCDRPMARDRGKAQSGRQRYKCGGCGTSTTGSGDASLGYDLEMAADRVAAIRRAVKNGANRFVITAAANNSEVNYSAWKSLQRFCDHRKALLMVIPIHYKNLSLYTAGQQYNKWWTKAVRPYLIDQDIRIGHKTYAMGAIRIQATAANPLSGMKPLAGDKWVIFGHSQQALEPVATPVTDLPGRMYATGAITRKSYSQTKQGAKASFHHIMGALYVETQGKKVFVRQLNVDGQGHFYDLDELFTPDKVIPEQTALGATIGDEHVKFMLPNVKKATFTARDSIINTLRPEFIIRHDVVDGYAGSHHHKDYKTQYSKFYHGDNDYRQELEQVADHLNETTPDFATSYIVKDSNHHSHLEQWLDKADDRLDHVNADLICELRSTLREAIRSGDSRDIFELWIRPKLHVNALFLDPNVPCMIGGVDHSQHGHRGANGARGSAKGISTTTHKATIGHSHAAHIVNSVYQVGKSCGVLEYESGLSSHTNTHCIQYPNGKRTLVDILGNAWRATNKPRRGGLPS